MRSLLALNNSPTDVIIVVNISQEVIRSPSSIPNCRIRVSVRLVDAVRMDCRDRGLDTVLARSQPS